MAEIINGVPIGDLPGIGSVPDDSMLVVEFLGKAYHMPGAVLRQMIQDVLDSMGDSVDDVTEARLTAAIETVLSSGKYNGVSPSVEVLDEDDGTTVIHIIDAFGDKKYPVEVKGATDAVRYKPQSLTDAQKAQARANIGALSAADISDKDNEIVIVKISGSFDAGYTVLWGGNPAPAKGLDVLVENGSIVIGVADGDLTFNFLDDTDYNDPYTVPAGTVFSYRNSTFWVSHIVDQKGEIINMTFALESPVDTWLGSVYPEQYTIYLTGDHPGRIVEFFGRKLEPREAYEILLAAANNDIPLLCYQKDAVFKLEDGSTHTPQYGTPFYYDHNTELLHCEHDGYECTLYVDLDDYKATAEKNTPYKTAESKADDLKAEDGTLFLLSAGEPIGAGVPLPTGNADDSKIFIADLNTSTYEDIKAANDAGKICYALWGGYTACMLTTLSGDSAIFTTLLDPHLGLYVKFTAGITGVSDFGLTESHSILYKPQSLTDAQKAQARENIGALSADDIDVDSIGSNVFVGKYDTITYAEIKAAHDAGKVCFLDFNGISLPLLGVNDTEAMFVREINENTDYRVTITSAGGKDFTIVDKNISDVYVVSLFSAKYAEVKAAYDAGKACFVTYGALLCPLTVLDEEKAEFVGMLTPHLGIKGTVPAEGNPDFTYVRSNAVQTVAQTLSDDQKAQARSNIGAAAAADIATTKYASTSTSSQSIFKISDFGSWGTGAWYQKGFSMLITSRAGETVWFSLSANDSATTARAFRLMNTYSKIAGVYYSVSENAVYVKAAGWCNNVTAHILSNIGGDYVPTVASVSGLASDVVEVNIIEFGPASSGLAVGCSSTPLLLGGSATRPTYNGADMALSSDLSGYLPLGGGTITGALSINNKLTQGSPSGDASVASMNRFHADLFVQGNGIAPNVPTVAGFYLGKSESDENRHMDIVSGGDYSYIDFNKAGRGTDFDARLLVNVASGWTDFMWGSHGDITQRVLNVNGSLRQNGAEVLTWGNAGTDSILPVRLRTCQDHNNAVSDPNLATETGFHYVNTATNRPPFSQSTNVDYRVLTTAYSDQWLQQIATDFRCGDMFLRRRENGTWTPWVRFATAGDLSGYLPLGGGLMTGSLKFQDSSLPQKSLEFICGIDAFANGGEMGWQSKAEFLSGYALKSDIPTNYAKQKTYNDFVHDSNEITMVPAGYSHGGLYFNYRTASGQYDGNINNYVFCNGKGGSAGVTLTADSFSGTAARATADGNGRNIVSTYATKDEVVTAANGSLKVTLSGTSVDKTLAQIETALNAGRHVYLVEGINVYQLSYHMAGMVAAFTSVLIPSADAQVSVRTVMVWNGMAPSVFTKTL